MKKKILIIIGVIVILGAIGGGIGYYMMKKPVKNFADSKAEITLSAKDLFNEFVANETSANAKYVAKDKTIQVAGKITEIKPNDDGTTVISIDVTSPDGVLSCSVTKKEESAKVAKYAVGAQITIKGQCTGIQTLINNEVTMMRCGIVE